MDFMPLDLGSFGDALLRGDSSTVNSRLARVRAKTTNKRAYRNALYRSKMNESKLPPEIQKFRKENPNAYGLPRGYKIFFQDYKSDGEKIGSIDGASLIFGQFGCNTGGVMLNNRAIVPDNNTWNESLNSHLVSGTVKLEDGEDVYVRLSINFITDHPTGTLSMGGRLFNIKLEPSIIWFSVDVSHDAGVYFSSADSSLKWDVDSDKWKNATWQQTLKFGYNVIREYDPIINQTFSYVQNYFTDQLPSEPAEFNLLRNRYGSDYTSSIDGRVSSNGSMLTTTVAGEQVIPKPPDERKGNNVESVFPIKLNFEFNMLADVFAGAFRSKNGPEYKSYGVKGTYDWDPFPMLEKLNAADEKLPVINILPVAPMGRSTSANDSLSVQGIASISPMEPDPNDPSGYRDKCAAQAMQDFHDIIVYYMDEDLRKLFISATPPVLYPKVKAIADENPTENAAFYKKLQVPYLASFLGRSTMEEGTHVNAARSDKLLRAIPVDDPTYERQSTLLYQMRFKESFPEISEYLKDQKTIDYTAKIDGIGKQMKKNLDQNSEGLEDVNSNFEDDLAKAKADIDSLTKWAKDKRLYWPMMLLYFIQTASLPNWYGQYVQGTASSSLGITMKSLNGTFGVLEDNQVNPAEDGVNFMQAFNQQMQLFQMTSLIPQLVDLDNISTEFDNILKQSLYEYWKTYKDSDNEEMAQNAADALELYQNNEMRLNFYYPLLQAQKLGAAAATWDSITKIWEDTCKESSWWKKTGNALKKLSIMEHISTAVMIFLPIFTGGLGSMEVDELISWISSVVGVAAFVALKVTQGAFRLFSVWKDIGGVGDALKVAFGFKKTWLKFAGKASSRIESAFGKFFVRSAAETAKMEASEFTLIQKMFGRNMGEVLANIAGIVLSIITIVTTAIDLARQTAPLMIASDIFMILSATIQILGTAMGWVAAIGAAGGAAGALATAVPALTLCASCAGPVAILFAAIGFILFIVYMFTQKPPNPVEEFVNKHVKDAGLYMDHLSIDYFQDIPPNQTDPGMVGVSIRTALVQGSTSSEATGSSRVYMQLQYDLTNPDNSTPEMKWKEALDYSNQDIWSLGTDAYGNSIIYTRKYSKDGNTTEIYYLATNDDENRVEARKLPSKEDDEDGYKKAMSKCQWLVETLDDPDVLSDDPEDDNYQKPTKALVRIKRGSKTLGLELSGDKGSPSSWILYDSPPKYYASAWMLEMQPLGPSSLDYQLNPWKLSTDETDCRDFPLLVPSETSYGLKWSVSPAVPDTFEFITSTGSDEGCVRLKEGQTATEMEATSYQVTAELNLNNGQTIQRSCILVIEVEDVRSTLIIN